MADITKCTNEDCCQKNECYRYMAEASKYWQSYAKFERDMDGCKYFWHIQSIAKTTRIEALIEIAKSSYYKR